MNTAGQTVTELWARGYAALPCPRQVLLAEGGLALEGSWQLAPGAGMAKDDVALEVLAAGWRERFGLAPALSGKAGPRTLSLEVKPGTAAAGPDDALARQSYVLSVEAGRVVISGHAPQGLFYGVQTLLQLLRPLPDGRCELPRGRIEDGPDRAWRILHYDTKHHQDRLETVKAMLSRAAAFKANAIAWEIEDKFAYRKHPLIGAPGAFTREQLQEITAHALRHYVEIIPIVQGPSHLAFVLKHERYAHLREDLQNNYMLCPGKPESYELLFDLYDELIEATPGCRFFHVGTDEPYFLGDREACGCRARREAIGQGGMMAEFIARCAAHLAKKGRAVLCWGEEPLEPRHVPSLPRGIVNAVYQGPEMSEAYRRQGIRELIYCPAQGDRPLFPDYFMPQKNQGPSRLEGMFHTLSFGPARRFDPLGILIGTWDDSGLHLETFWLGWATGLAYGWNPGTPGPAEAAAQFMRLFHGPEAVGMAEAWILLDRLARFWEQTWDSKPSLRGPGYKRQWHPRHDRTLALPRVPDAETLDNEPFFTKRYAEVLARTAQAGDDLRRLQALLLENLGRVRRNRHALEVFLSLAHLIQEHVRLVRTLAGLEATLDEARKEAGAARLAQAFTRLREASRAARACVLDRERMFANLTATWEKSRCPKGMAIDGRAFVHIQDHTKNHEADWTPDLGYLVKASRDLDLEGWADRVDAAAQAFMERHPNIGRAWRPGGNFEELKGYEQEPGQA